MQNALWSMRIPSPHSNFRLILRLFWLNKAILDVISGGRNLNMSYKIICDAINENPNLKFIKANSEAQF